MRAGMEFSLYRAGAFRRQIIVACVLRAGKSIPLLLDWFALRVMCYFSISDAIPCQPFVFLLCTQTPGGKIFVGGLG
jgi:hypothetical protein